VEASSVAEIISRTSMDDDDDARPALLRREGVASNEVSGWWLAREERARGQS
jgi:hypothetical protein